MCPARCCAYAPACACTCRHNNPGLPDIMSYRSWALHPSWHCIAALLCLLHCFACCTAWPAALLCLLQAPIEDAVVAAPTPAPTTAAAATAPPDSAAAPAAASTAAAAPAWATEPAEQFQDAPELPLPAVPPGAGAPLPPLPAPGRDDVAVLLYLHYMCRTGDQTVALLQASCWGCAALAWPWLGLGLAWHSGCCNSHSATATL